MAPLRIGHSAYVRSMVLRSWNGNACLGARDAGRSTFSISPVSRPYGFAIEFAVEDVSVFSSSGLSAPAASVQSRRRDRQRWLAADVSGVREVKILVPLEVLLRSGGRGFVQCVCSDGAGLPDFRVRSSGSDRRSEDEFSQTCVGRSCDITAPFAIVHTPSLPA